MLPDEIDVLPDEVVVLVPRDGLCHADGLFLLLTSIALVFRRRGRCIDDTLGTLVECALGVCRSVDGEHDPGTPEIVDLFQQSFGRRSVLVQIELKKLVENVNR